MGDFRRSPQRESRECHHLHGDFLRSLLGESQEYILTRRRSPVRGKLRRSQNRCSVAPLPWERPLKGFSFGLEVLGPLTSHLGFREYPRPPRRVRLGVLQPD